MLLHIVSAQAAFSEWSSSMFRLSVVRWHAGKQSGIIEQRLTRCHLG